MEAFIAFLVSAWPVISGVVLAIVGIFVMVWRVYTQARLNDRAIRLHCTDDKVIHDGLYKLVSATQKSIERLDTRIGIMSEKVHETSLTVSKSDAKHDADMVILKNRVDMLSGSIADLKISIESSDNTDD